MCKENSLIASESFEVAVDGLVFVYRLELLKSQLFNYGNSYCVGLYCDDNLVSSIDVRYESRCNTVEGFREWALEWLTEYCRKDCVITRC